MTYRISSESYPGYQECAVSCYGAILRYRHLSVSNTIMDGNILATGEFEVMLSKGLGRHVAETEKQPLFQDAKNIADLLVAVMDRRTQELTEGKRQRPSHMHSPQRPKKIKKGLEELGQAKRLQAEWTWLEEGQHVSPGLQQLRPEDLPPGVRASRGYDHRGHCVTFEHETLGELGKIVLVNIRDGQTLIQAEIYKGQEKEESPLVQKKKDVFGKIVATVNKTFDENFPW